jgi:hypothetical protein
MTEELHALKRLVFKRSKKKVDIRVKSVSKD